MSVRRAQDERIEGTPDGLNQITEIMDVPDAPTIGTATAAGLSASVTFTQAVTGGTPTSFTVTSSPGGFTGTGASAPITVSGLSDGTSYTFTVTATNANGTSPASSASNSITAAAPMEGAYDVLASVTISSATPSISFTGIPTGYTHLQISGLVRTATSAVYDAVFMRINGDAAANYFRHLILSDGTNTPQSYGYANESKLNVGYMAGNTAEANSFGVFVTDIVDYTATTKYKTMKSIGGQNNNSVGSAYVNMSSGAWANTSAVSSLTFYTESGSNFSQYTQINLYGVK
jgi:hypothetical protein